MGCITNLRTDYLQNASTGGTWTYNGAILITGSANPYDGDVDNTTQFSTSADTIPSPPGELPAAGNPVTGGDNPSIDSTGHTVAYYSFTYEVTSGSCTGTTNIVMPLIDAANAGDDATHNECETATWSINLWDQVDDGDTATIGMWTQIAGFPNPHPGFDDGEADPTTATFDFNQMNYPSDTFPMKFTFTTNADVPTGYTLAGDCASCLTDSATVTVSVSSAHACTM
jgi:hypothetical protein